MDYNRDFRSIWLPKGGADYPAITWIDDISGRVPLSENERTGLTKVTKNTYSIHHFDASGSRTPGNGDRENGGEKRESVIFYIFLTVY